MGAYKCEKIAQRRTELWTELHTTFIAEDDRRGQTLHFDVEGQSIRLKKDDEEGEEVLEEVAPTTTQTPVTWSPTMPAATRSAPDEILGAPRSQLLRSKTDNHFDGAPPTPIPKQEGENMGEEKPPLPPPRRKRDSLTRQQSAQELSHSTSPFASMVSYNRKTHTPDSPLSSPSSRRAPPPVPSRDGPTRARATRQMVDSRYEQRFRPLSILVSGDSPLLPTVEAALSSRTAAKPPQAHRGAPPGPTGPETTIKRRSPPPLPATRLKPSTLPSHRGAPGALRKGKTTTHQNGTFPRRGVVSSSSETSVPRRFASTSAVKNDESAPHRNSAPMEPRASHHSPPTLSPSTPPPLVKQRHESQRDLKASTVPHNTYDHVVIDEDSPVPSPRKTKHAAIRISKATLEGGLNTLIDVSASGWTEEITESPNTSPPRRAPPSVPKPPPRRELSRRALQ